MPNTDRFAGIVTDWRPIVKLENETRNSDATLANDDELLFTMAAETKYAVRGRIFFDTAAAADFKFALTGPASPTLVRILRKHVDPNALTTLIIASEVAYTASTAVAGGTGTTGGWVEFDAIIHNGDNEDTFAFQWAQNTSNAGDTIVRAGSYLEYRAIV
jgi:hypothetical protein